MQFVKEIFQERVNEINRYYTFISSFSLENPDKELNKILRSNLILMLYNLVESSITNSIEEIHSNIYTNRISFNVLNIELKKILIRQIKNMNPHTFVQSINDIAIDIIKQAFNKRQISDGNIDNDTIVKLGRQYGFCTFTNYQDSQSGRCLKAIKGRRNDLAHGTYSFTEIGKEYTIEDLGRMKNEAIKYLAEIIQNIELYLNSKSYILPEYIEH